MMKFSLFISTFPFVTAEFIPTVRAVMSDLRCCGKPFRVFVLIFSCTSSFPHYVGGMHVERSREDKLALLGRFSPATAEWERRELLRLSPEAQEKVLDRVSVMTDYLALTKPSAEEAESAAGLLGIGRSNFYRMLARYKSKGALLGLTPHARLKARPRIAGEGSDYSAHVRKLVEAHPTEKTSFYMRALEEIALQRDGSRPPSWDTVRRWVTEYRAPTNAPPRVPAARARPKGDAVFGRELLIDQIGVGVKIGDDKWGDELVATFIADVDTRLLIGAGFGWPLDEGRGLYGAMKDTDTFWSAPLLGSFKTVRLAEKITWVVPPSWPKPVKHFRVQTAEWGINGVAIDTDDREHGARLFELMGGTFAHQPLQVFRGRALPPRPDVASSTSGHVFTAPAGMDIEPTHYILPLASEFARAIEAWNIDLVRRHEKARVVLPGPTWDKRIAAWTAKSRVSDMEGSELAILLDPDMKLPETADRLAVRSISRSFHERNDQTSD